MTVMVRRISKRSVYEILIHNASVAKLRTIRAHFKRIYSEPTKVNQNGMKHPICNSENRDQMNLVVVTTVFDLGKNLYLKLVRVLKNGVRTYKCNF